MAPLRNLLTAIAAAALTAAAPPRVTDADVRDFVVRQERAWNTGDLDAWAATFAPSARFTDQTRSGDDMVTYGVATLPQAREQARRVRAKAQVQDVSVVDRVIVSPAGGQATGARVIVRKVSRIETDGRVRRSCAISAQDLRLSGGRLRSLGRTDTLYRCRPAAR
jgi:hypothetical protein